MFLSNLFVSFSAPVPGSRVYIWTHCLILAPLFTFIYRLKGWEWWSETFFTVTQAACQCHHRHVMKGLCFTSSPAANDAKMLKFSNNFHPVFVSVSLSGACLCASLTAKYMWHTLSSCDYSQPPIFHKQVISILQLVYLRPFATIMFLSVLKLLTEPLAFVYPVTCFSTYLVQYTV